MRLRTVKLTNFRGYQATTIIPIDSAMTGIVGRNDYGKSTILEALAIFFESGDVKAGKSAMNGFSQRIFNCGGLRVSEEATCQV